MSLHEIIAAVERDEKTLTLLNPGREDLVAEAAAYFDEQNVLVTEERTVSGRPAGVALLTGDGEVLAATTTDAVVDLLNETASGPGGLGVDDSDYHDLLSHLKETTFTAYDKDEMVMASREIEDRAWRVGEGRLFAGFQYESILLGQARTYETLASGDLDVYAFAAPDGESVDPDGVTTHVDDDPELAESWFVVFDGGPDRAQGSALVAESRGENSYYGFWTYDPRIVSRVIDHLETTYATVFA